MRGLLMIEPLYHQTVAGKKRQTRRSGGLDEVNGREATKTKPAIVTNPTEWLIDEIDTGGPIPWVSWNGENSGDNKPILSVTFRKKNTPVNSPPICKPRYHVGEVLFLKEPTAWLNNSIVYKFSQPDQIKNDPRFKWGNKLFMPSSQAREYVKITGIKCERLLDISDADCMAEGIETFPAPGGIDNLIYKQYGKFDGPAFCLTPKNSFISLFKFANKVKTVPNIWVWVYSYEFLKDYRP